MESKIMEWLDLARIDIKNQGEGNDVKINVKEGKRCNLYQPKWFSKSGAGYVLETYDRHIILELDCVGTGNLLIRLRGVDRRFPKGDRLPLWVDYTRLVVNGKEVFSERKPLWHDKSYTFVCQVSGGDKIKAEISWDLHGYKGEELARLIDFCSTQAKSVSVPKLPQPAIQQSVIEDVSYTPDILWAQIYHDTIIDSKWLLDKAISPGGKRGWAVGYNFLYVLYRVLNEMKPQHILELGLGQSTKLTSQYAEYYKAEHVVVEHDREWEAFFRDSFSLSYVTKVVQRNLMEQEYDGARYYAYEDFVGVVGELSGACDLILIDGPFGYGRERSRRDIVPHLPEILAENFVIIIDDCGRKGEANLLEEIKAILDREGKEYAAGIYRGSGACHVGVIVDEGHRFFTSM